MASQKCLRSGCGSSFVKMIFMYFHTYCLFCVLLLPYGMLTTDELSLKLWSSDGSEIVYWNSFNNKIIQYFYNYTYSVGNGDIINVACTAHDSGMNSVLSWTVLAPSHNHTSCPEQNVTELNYITKLTNNENGNKLQCHLKENNTIQATAQVTFLCPTCIATTTPTLNTNCYHTDSVNTYVNGVYSKDKRNRIIESKKDEILTVHCEIKADEDHVLELITHDVEPGSILFNFTFSNSLVVHKLIMTDMLDNRTTSCRKRNIKNNLIVAISRIQYKLRSNLYINITYASKDHEPWTTYRTSTVLPYSGNDTISLVCVWRSPIVLTMEWLKDGKSVELVDNRKLITYQANISRQDSNTNLTCQLKSGNLDMDGHYIILKYNEPEQKTRIPKEKGNSLIPLKQMGDTEWIAVGIAATVLMVIIILIACKYKTWQSATPAALRNEISYINFQNTYTVPEGPNLDPMYSGPVDDVSMYAYTYNQKSSQETYSTPFVPTVDEMYTKPTPKKQRSGKEPLYQLPGKFTYANLQVARPNQQDPSYSNVTTTGDAGDDASETYTYCTPAGYGRPE